MPDQEKRIHEDEEIEFPDEEPERGIADEDEDEFDDTDDLEEDEEDDEDLDPKGGDRGLSSEVGSEGGSEGGLQFERRRPRVTRGSEATTPVRTGRRS